MAWTRSRITALTRLIAADPWASPGELTRRFNAATGCSVTSTAVGKACEYYGIQRVCKVAPEVQKELFVRQAAVGWIDRYQLVKVVVPAIKAATARCVEGARFTELHCPEVPLEDRYSAEVFVDAVLDELREELCRQAQAAGVPSREGYWENTHQTPQATAGVCA